MKGLKKNNKIPESKTPVCPDTLKDYESLRLYALEGTYNFSRPLGLDLFLKKGFLFWIKAGKESKAYDKFNSSEETKIKGAIFLPNDLQQEITMLLANMILEQRSGNVSV
ncbi:MAG: hypothetical protein ACYDIA_23850 [Candidatus Humimicrobiaceae bacterium]